MRWRSICWIGLAMSKRGCGEGGPTRREECRKAERARRGHERHDHCAMVKGHPHRPKDLLQSPHSGYWKASRLNMSSDAMLSSLLQKGPKHRSKSRKHLIKVNIRYVRLTHISFDEGSALGLSVGGK